MNMEELIRSRAVCKLLILDAEDHWTLIDHAIWNLNLPFERRVSNFEIFLASIFEAHDYWSNEQVFVFEDFNFDFIVFSAGDIRYTDVCDT